MRFSRPLTTGLMLVWLVACAPTQENPASDLTPFEVIAHGQHSGFTMARSFEFNTARQFLDFWSIHNQYTQTPPPRIDFDSRTVLAVFMGEQRTGGFDIRIEKIREQETHVDVLVQLIRPARDSLRTMALTQPFMMVAISKTDKPVRYHFYK